MYFPTFTHHVWFSLQRLRGMAKKWFDASRRGEKELRSSRDKRARHVVGSGGKKSLLRDPGSASYDD